MVVYYNMWHISLWFAPDNTNTRFCINEYEVRENALSEELNVWTRICALKEDEFASEPDRRYFDKYIKGAGMLSLVAELIEYEEDQPSVFEEQ